MVDQRDQRLLVGGFSLGILAGSIGFYLFGTEEGRRLRQRLNDEWEQAQDYFQQQRVFGEKQPQNLAEFLKTLKEKAMEELALDPDLFSTAQVPDKSTESKKRRLPTKKSPPKKFVGT